MKNMLHVLMIVTSHDRLGSTAEKTGLWLEELATPYYVFADAGFTIDIASPKGGRAPIDPKSQGEEKPKLVARFLEDRAALAKAEQTLALDAVDASKYDAIFLVGGHGTMWDLPNSSSLARVIETINAKGGVVAAVCHGPAGLVSAKKTDGEPLVRGKRVTAFTNAEEDAVRLTGVVPFPLESKLRELGAVFEGGKLWAAHAVRDGNLITGQNPASSAAVAEHVVAALAK